MRERKMLKPLPLPTMAEFVILSIISNNNGPIHGKKIIDRSRGFLTTAGGYTQLYRMLDKGMIKNSGSEKQEKGERGNVKRLYDITKAGTTLVTSLHSVGASTQ